MEECGNNKIENCERRMEEEIEWMEVNYWKLGIIVFIAREPK